MVVGSWLRFGRWQPFGADLFVHQYVLVAIAALVVLALRNWLLAVTCLASYIAIILVHEVGHAAVAHQLGYDINAIRIGLIHGHCEYEHPDSAWHASLVSWGGVLAQLMIATLVFVVAGFLSGKASDLFGPVVILLGYINLTIAAMNLTPRAPFDGYLAWRIFPAIVEKLKARGLVRAAIKRASKRR
jgi:stage IV sporulation protein FB